MELREILDGSEADGTPKHDPVERQMAAERTEAKPEPAAVEQNPDLAPDGNPRVGSVKSRRKQHQEREFNAQADGAGRKRDEVTGQFVPKESAEPKAEAKPEAEAKSEVEAKPEAEAAQEQEAKKEPPKQEFTEKELAFLKAAQEERRKRQELQQQLAALQQNAQPQEKKTFWDDPEGVLQQFQQQVQTVALRTRLDTSEAIARQRYQDFDQNVQLFGELMQATPGLREQMLNSHDPAEFAYRAGKAAKEFREIGNIEEYRARVAKEERARIEAEFRQKYEQNQRKAQELPPSLSETSARPAPNRAVYNGPVPLDEIVRPGAR